MKKNIESKQLINLNQESPDAIERFMRDNELYTCAAIGEYVELSRERVRQIFKNRQDLDFKEMKRRVVKQKFKQTNLFKWKLITFVKTKHPYYVSECGQVARDVTFKKHGVEMRKRKLLKPSANKSKHLRVNLTLENGEHKTFYLQQIVGHEFLPEPTGDKKVKGVTFKDGDLANCHKDNLEWSYLRNVYK